MSTPRAWSLVPLALAAMLIIWARPAAAEANFADRARGMFPQADHVGAIAGSPPAAEIRRARRLIGYALLTHQVAPIPADSEKPIRVLVGIDTSGVIRGAEILAHEEPILVIGVTDQALADFTAQYAGSSVGDKFTIGG